MPGAGSATAAAIRPAGGPIPRARPPALVGRHAGGGRLQLPPRCYVSRRCRQYRCKAQGCCGLDTAGVEEHADLAADGCGGQVLLELGAHGADAAVGAGHLHARARSRSKQHTGVSKGCQACGAGSKPASRKGGRGSLQGADAGSSCRGWLLQPPPALLHPAALPGCALPAAPPPRHQLSAAPR